MAREITKNYLGQERHPDDLRKLAEEMQDLITTYVAMPENRHGTGCNCRNNIFWKDRCPVGESIYRKIEKLLGVTLYCSCVSGLCF